jgi:hypothetical protein
MNTEMSVIKWIDSTYYRIDYANSEEDIPKISTKVLISCGFLVDENENSITISQDLVEDSDAKRLVLCIPKVSIIKYTIFTKELNDF